MTTEDIIIHIFYHVDNGIGVVKKDPCEKLYPSEVVTIGILFALKSGSFRAFYRWLSRDFAYRPFSNARPARRLPSADRSPTRCSRRGFQSRSC